MRGKASQKAFFPPVQRITPAYAGKRSESSSSSFASWDHPRLCGEKPRSCKTSVSRPGSPPPMRGKGEIPHDFMSVARITPAYAGKSSRYGLFCAENKDHPRLCGEKPSPAKRNCYETGSPPPMRGKVYEKLKEHHETGITPAYAGKRAESLRTQTVG